jgi:uncharacterized membrane protein YcaP (DUF421 family)
MEATSIILRTLLIYFFINVILRVMGKREIGKLSVFDLVISIMIAEAAVLVIEDVNRPLWEGILPIAILAMIQIVIAFVTLKSRRARSIFEGTPSVIIENGKLKRDEMRKQRYSLDDLIMQLREKNVYNVADVEFAILETTGKLTVETKDNFRKGATSASSGDKSGNSSIASSDSSQGQKAAKSQQDSKSKANNPINIRYEGLPLALIMDGKVQEENLKLIGKTRFWLKNELQARGVKDAKDVFFCSIDHHGKIFLDKKER